MATYYVSKKQSTPHGVIESLLVHLVNANNTFAMPGEIWSRTHVVAGIQAGHRFFTITASRIVVGSWDVGAEIKIFPVTVNYLKTAQNNQPGDNLDNLPAI